MIVWPATFCPKMMTDQSITAEELGIEANALSYVSNFVFTVAVTSLAGPFASASRALAPETGHLAQLPGAGAAGAAPEPEPEPEPMDPLASGISQPPTPISPPPSITRRENDFFRTDSNFWI